MFTALRIRLIGYVVVVLTLVLTAAGALVYVLVTRELDAGVDAALRLAAARVLAVSPSMVLPAGTSPPYGAAEMRADANVAVEGDAASVAGEPLIPGYVPQTPVPTVDGSFVLVVSDAAVLSLYGETPQGLPDRAAVAAARAGGEDLRSVDLENGRYRLLTRAARDERGAVVLVTQSGVPLAERDRQQRGLFLSLTGGGLLGLALAVAGGVFLTGRALVPVQAAFVRQRRFVADASHELRTPLTLLRLETESLAHRLDAARETRPLLTQIDRIGRLVRDLLTLARLDERALPLEREPVPVAALVHTAGAAAQRLARSDVMVETSAPMDVCVAGDPDQLHQVLLVLVDNACRATPAGGRVRLHVECNATTATILVEDTGSGIPAEHLPRVFERFYRIDDARSDAEGGSGLGLAIARGIVEAHSGTLTLAARPGGGTIATLRLPVDRP